MERKKTCNFDRPAMPDLADFLPKVPAKQTPLQTKHSRPKYTEGSIESEISLFSKVLKTDLSLLVKVNKLNEEKKIEVHLPVLSKRDLKKELGTSISNYRSPTLSPCFTRSEFAVGKKQEKISPYEQEINEIAKDLEIQKNESGKRGASAARALRPRKVKVNSKHSSKQREANLDVLLMNRNNSDLSLLMHEYVRRQGLPENSKIFILTGQHDFIRRALKKRSWIENKNSTSHAFHLKWSFSDSDYDYKSLKSGQTFNHFLCNRELTTKSGLGKNLRNLMDCKINIDSFFPRCYDLGDNIQIKELVVDYQRTAALNILKKAAKGFFVDQKVLFSVISYAEGLVFDALSKCEKQKKIFRYEDVTKICEYEVKGKGEISPESLLKVQGILQKLREIYPQFDMEGEENIWIIKPGQNARGSGVHCVRSLQEIIDSGANMQSRVVQKYTESPLLLPTNVGFCKFDLRIWVLVTSFDPLSIYFYNACYCRVCQEAYSLVNLDSSVHLANYSVQKNIAKAQSDTVWSLTRLISYLDSLKVSWTEILKKIHYLTISTLQAVAENIDSRQGCFELYGFDVILDQNFQPWLLEVNLSPACAERTEWITEMLDFMGEKLLNIVLDEEIHEPLYDFSLRLNRDIVENTQEWIFLYKSESTGEEYSLTKANLEIFGEKFNVKREKNNERKYLTTKAAFVLQKHGKRFLLKIRAEKKKINHNVLNIQKMVRRKMAYIELNKKVRIAAAIKVQSFWRRILAFRIFKNLKKIKNIEFVQSVMKGFLTQSRFKTLKVDKACLCIQTVTRAMFASIQVDSKKHYLTCVKYIQSFYKKRFVFLNKSAIKLQKMWRGVCGRARFSKEKRFQTSIITIQKTTRRFLSQLEKNSRKNAKASKTIASYEKTRIRLKSLNFFFTTRAAIIIQKYWRRHTAIKLLSDKKKARNQFIQSMLYIQKILKGTKERKRFKILREKRSAILIQRYFREYRVKKYQKVLEIVNSSALKIQKNFKGYKCRCRYAMMKRVLNEEANKRKNALKLKKDKEKRAIIATERLFKGRPLPEVSSFVLSKLERQIFDIKSEKIERMKSIYVYKDDSDLISPLKYERKSLIRDVIDEFKPSKKERSRPRKSKKKPNTSGTQYGKMQY